MTKEYKTPKSLLCLMLLSHSETKRKETISKLSHAHAWIFVSGMCRLKNKEGKQVLDLIYVQVHQNNKS